MPPVDPQQIAVESMRIAAEARVTAERERKSLGKMRAEVRRRFVASGAGSIVSIGQVFLRGCRYF